MKIHASLMYMFAISLITLIVQLTKNNEYGSDLIIVQTSDKAS